ncbi:hypothetical protein Krac_9644 [Ktedonobacter racemifer DSM 44963]|uniref:Uncharacterized protein n=1 Tax=Ktedonobacter racemifer DSM 44963 TaxID=485913 RepID=D6TCW4_KTERA|nr:hypothetical protein Krac_9644 [Ktedonobacter racemifer DSM 44963]
MYPDSTHGIPKETMRRNRTTRHGTEDETTKSSCYPGVPEEFTLEHNSRFPLGILVELQNVVSPI